MSHKALIAFTELGVKAIRSTRAREPHPPCPKISSLPFHFRAVARKKVTAAERRLGIADKLAALIADPPEIRGRPEWSGEAADKRTRCGPSG